jgi:hypothetical protein
MISAMYVVYNMIKLGILDVLPDQRNVFLFVI